MLITIGSACFCAIGWFIVRLKFLLLGAYVSITQQLVAGMYKLMTPQAEGPTAMGNVQNSQRTHYTSTILRRFHFSTTM